MVLEKRKQPVSVETPTYTASANARSALTPISSSTSHTTSAQEALSPSTSSCSVKEVAELFHVLFGFEPKYGNSSIFVGDKMIEIVKENGRGTNGHICIAVDDMAKAMDELKEKGVAFDESSAKYKNGELTAIYFKDEIAGFAIHLLKN